jgi:hypothetical protein
LRQHQQKQNKSFSCIFISLLIPLSHLIYTFIQNIYIFLCWMFSLVFSYIFPSPIWKPQSSFFFEFDFILYPPRWLCVPVGGKWVRVRARNIT